MLEIKLAQEEAVDNARWMRPLRKYLEAFMEPPVYPALPETFKARTSTQNSWQLSCATKTLDFWNISEPTLCHH